jgi:predicted transcriptional regulator of viral defense system
MFDSTCWERREWLACVMEKLNNIEVMHDTDRKRPDHQCLFEVASEQSGYFTTAQAEACGYSSNLRAYHARKGRWVRVRRGLYRLSEYPSSDREEVIAAWLWAGKDSAVISHESALDLLDLSDVIPGTIHITIPRSRRYRPAPAGLTLHTTTRNFDPDEVTTRGGVRVTSAVRTILDCAETGTAPEQIVSAVRQAVDQGLATRRQLETGAASRGGRVERLILRALDEAVS